MGASAPATIVDRRWAAHHFLVSHSDPSWELYATFLAVMREGSLSAAARRLGVAQPTVRHRVEALERGLGAVLFPRARTGLVPTAAATGGLPQVEAMAAMAEAITRGVGDASAGLEGTVRIGVSEIMGVEVMPGVLASLRRVEPDLRVELVLSNRNEDLLRGDADLAVRMVAPTQAALVARKLGTVEIGLYAAPAYLDGRPEVRAQTLSRDHVLVGGDRDRSVADALAAAGVASSARDYGLRCDSQVAQLAAVRAGVGIGVCQRPLATRPPGLRRVLPQLAVALGVWVVTHEDLRSSRRVRAVFDHLVQEFGGYLASG